MMLKKIFGMTSAILGMSVTVSFGIAVYFYRRTMIRSKAKTERTMKMAGTDWNKHMPFIQERKEAMLNEEHSDKWIISKDGLKLHATWFPQSDCKKIVICFHGYTSQGMKDYIGLSGYYLKRGYSMLLVDERAHGESEGKYIGFGCLDRQDALQWVDWVLETCGEGGGIEAAKQKHDVIMTPTTYLYFDYYQTKDIENEPLAIGGYLPLQNVYNYEPIANGSLSISFV